MMNFGSHISIRHGYVEAAKTAASIGATCFQYFPKNPRSLSVKEFDKHDAFACAEFCKEHGIVSISHTPYPTDLTPIDKKDQIIASLLNDLEITEACGSIGVVVHFGARTSEVDPLSGYKNMIEMLNEVLQEWNGNTLLLIENNAGKSGPMGTTLEELTQVRKLVNEPEKIGFCLDTCHLFASGVWDGDNWDEVEQKGRELDFFSNVKAVHFNNSKYPSGSMKDRHANIRDGCIPIESFHPMIASPFLSEIPFILETPRSEIYSHEDEIRDLHKLFK